MARRSDIDWEAIEADYRINAISTRRIAEKHGVADSAVRNRAKRGGWERDLSRTVELATKSAMIKQAQEKAQEKAQSELKGANRGALEEAIGAEIGAEKAKRVISGVEAAVSQRVGVLTKHQAIVADMMETVVNQHIENKVAAAEAKTLLQIAEMITEGDPDAAKEIRRLTSLNSRVGTQKQIVESVSRLITEERRAHGIKDEEAKSGIKEEMDELFARLNDVTGEPE